MCHPLRKLRRDNPAAATAISRRIDDLIDRLSQDGAKFPAQFNLEDQGRLDARDRSGAGCRSPGLQRAAHGERVNANVTDRYFSMASTFPQAASGVVAQNGQGEHVLLNWTG